MNLPHATLMFCYPNNYVAIWVPNARSQRVEVRFPLYKLAKKPTKHSVSETVLIDELFCALYLNGCSRSTPNFFVV